MPSTEWSRGLGLRVPIVNAPMGGAAGGRLAAAVSAAGGLGMIGMGSAGSVVALERELAAAGEIVGPWGIGVVDWVVAQEPELLAAAIAARPTLISVSFGAGFDWVERVHAAGILAVTQVYDAEEAWRAQDAGVDVLVARGSEGGGHGVDGMATLPLLDAVLETVSVPVLAAGGVGSGRSLAAVLAAGAAGAWVGTRLAAAEESLLSGAARQVMTTVEGTGTVLTSAFDAALEYPWPSRFPARVVHNAFLARHREDPGGAEARDELHTGIESDDRQVIPVDAGQGVGLLTEIEPVADIVWRMAEDAGRLLAGRAREVTAPRP
nr:nitronate monooxygenase [Nocardia thailandica]